MDKSYTQSQHKRVKLQFPNNDFVIIVNSQKNRSKYHVTTNFSIAKIYNDFD